MSYILDALKRADAERERERGAVPGLQSRHMPTPTIQAAHGMRNRVWLAAAAAALALGGIAAGLWFWQTPAVRLAAVEPAVQQAPTPAPPSAPAPAVAPPPIRAPAPPAAPKPVAKPMAPAPASGTQPPPRSKLGPAAGTAEPLATAPAVTASIPLPATRAAAVPLLGELPEDIRRQMPPLAISGAVYSKNPGQRLLLVNNQVVTQGSLAAPEVTLEEIQAKGSVFNFRGTRFRVAH